MVSSSNKDKLVSEIKKVAIPFTFHNKNYQVIEKKEEGVLSFNYYKLMNKKIKNSLRETHIFALENNIVPKRYLENVFHLGIEGQLKLIQSKVAIIGVGRLGGELAENLARLGVGEICVIDPTNIKEENLNSQKIALPEFISLNRSTVMTMRIRDINSAIEVCELSEQLSIEEYFEKLSEYDIVINTNNSIITNVNALDFALEYEKATVVASLASEGSHITTINPKKLNSNKEIPLRKLLAGIHNPDPAILSHTVSIVGGHLTIEILDFLLKGANSSENRVILL